MDPNSATPWLPRIPIDLARVVDRLRARVSRSPRQAIAGAALVVLLLLGGALVSVEASAPPAPPPPPGALAEGVAGPPTRASARYQAQNRRPTTIEEYEMVRAARF